MIIRIKNFTHLNTVQMYHNSLPKGSMSYILDVFRSSNTLNSVERDVDGDVRLLVDHLHDRHESISQHVDLTCYVCTPKRICRLLKGKGIGKNEKFCADISHLLSG